jgi:hypothetical protein
MNGSIAGEAICASLILLAGILGYVLGARRRPQGAVPRTAAPAVGVHWADPPARQPSAAPKHHRRRLVQGAGGSATSRAAEATGRSNRPSSASPEVSVTCVATSPAAGRPETGRDRARTPAAARSPVAAGRASDRPLSVSGIVGAGSLSPPVPGLRIFTAERRALVERPGVRSVNRRSGGQLPWLLVAGTRLQGHTRQNQSNPGRTPSRTPGASRAGAGATTDSSTSCAADPLGPARSGHLQHVPVARQLKRQACSGRSGIFLLSPDRRRDAIS